MFQGSADLAEYGVVSCEDGTRALPQAYKQHKMGKPHALAMSTSGVFLTVLDGPLQAPC